jgi:S-DNA-T family DNA segregation ATPase FtsK/SpoIIIE
MGWKKDLNRASASFRDAADHLERAQAQLSAAAAAMPSPDAGAAAQAELTVALGRAAMLTAPGFLSQDLQRMPAGTAPRRDPPIGTVHVRLGVAGDDPQTGFPVIVPLLGQGHLVIDGDASDPRVAGVLQSMVLRLAAAVPDLEMSFVDCVALGKTFSESAPLVAAGIAAATATDTAGLNRALDAAEAHVQEAQRARNDGSGMGEIPYHLVVVAGLPPLLSRAIAARIAALAHAGPHGRTHLILAGWRDESPHDTKPAIDNATYVTVDGHGNLRHAVHNVPLPVAFDAAPPPQLVRTVYGSLADTHREAAKVGISALLPPQQWQESSIDGLSTVVGRDSRGEVTLSFDDATPHWLVGGRTGGGKTVFLLDVLYGLAARYGPRELALYLLDFKEGVSFTEFTPRPHDQSWIPQVRAVGVESDREYGTAVLVALRAELSRRATAMKRAGVTKLADLRRARPDLDLPRIVAVIDEFHVLFAGNDRLAREAVNHLEELARKGRSYGVHLVLASQTISGVEALYAKTDSIFGQFPLRVALPGAKYVLDVNNTAAETITLGQAMVNHSGGVSGFDRLVHFPDATADTDLVNGLRARLWQLRDPDSAPPTVFAGYAEQHLIEDPRYNALSATTNRPAALVGRAVDVAISTVALPMDAVPGRHLAVVGTSDVGADIVQAATLSLARQHQPGDAEFLLAPLVAQADPACSETVAALAEDGHAHTRLSPDKLVSAMVELSTREESDRPVYLALFGADGAHSLLNNVSGNAFRAVLKHGPPRGVHVLGWWRGLRRFTDDLGIGGREDVACLVVLNVPGGEIGPFIGDIGNDYAPRQNRALVIDRHENTRRLFVPFVRTGRDFDRLVL